MIINKLIKHWNFNQDELAFIPKYWFKPLCKLPDAI
jgi:hypothetical protein